MDSRCPPFTPGPCRLLAVSVRAVAKQGLPALTDEDPGDFIPGAARFGRQRLRHLNRVIPAENADAFGVGEQPVAVAVVGLQQSVPDKGMVKKSLGVPLRRDCQHPDNPRLVVVLLVRSATA